MSGLSHKFDASHICIACGYSEGWVEKWKEHKMKTLVSLGLALVVFVAMQAYELKSWINQRRTQ